MNISNMKNFVNAKNDILKCFAHAVAQATDVSVAVARIYRWRNEVFRRHVARAKRIFYSVFDKEPILKITTHLLLKNTI